MERAAILHHVGHGKIKHYHTAIHYYKHSLGQFKCQVMTTLIIVWERRRINLSQIKLKIKTTRHSSQ